MTNDLKKPVVAAALGQKPSRYPIWFLRQAGRYLPEYMAVRSQLGFVDLCRNPKMAAEVTLQPLRRFDVDAAIIFSDILIPCTAMGQELTFDKGHGPQLSHPVRGTADLKRLRQPNAEKELGYVGDAISETKKALRPEQTMIGFCGAPFTVASYMIEGKGSREYTEVKRLLYTETEVFTGLLQLLVDVSVDYLMMQVKAGADCLMLFDSWANNLPAAQYRQHVFPAVFALVKKLKKQTDVPVIYYPGQGMVLYPELFGLNVDVVAIDWRCRLDKAIEMLRGVGLNVSVQGNIDPQIFIADEATVRKETRAILQQAKSARGHIFNVGHGLLPHTPPEAIIWAIDEIRGTKLA